MTIYCPTCINGFHPMEMEEVSYNTFRCPRCLHVRKVTPHLFRPDEIEDLSHTEAQEAIKSNGSALGAIAAVGAVALGLALLSNASKKE